MGYAVAAYAVTVLGVAGYALRLALARARLRDQLDGGSGTNRG